MALSLLAPCLLFVRKRWSLVALQWLTVPAAAVWLLAFNAIIQQRIFEHRAWTVSAVILGAVTAFTLFAGWLLNSAKVKQLYL